MRHIPLLTHMRAHTHTGVLVTALRGRGTGAVVSGQLHGSDVRHRGTCVCVCLCVFLLMILTYKLLNTHTQRTRIDGDVFGMRSDFKGFGVVLDVYDNDNNRNNPQVCVCVCVC
jgi:hypothetical protein